MGENLQQRQAIILKKEGTDGLATTEKIKVKDVSVNISFCIK